MRRHCDVCGEECKRDRGHVWANQLPQGDALRNISATITFHGNDRKAEADICDACFIRWVQNIYGSQQIPCLGAVREILRYSWDHINGDYGQLTDREREVLSPGDFDVLYRWAYR